MTEYRRALVPWCAIGTDAASAAIYLAFVAYPHPDEVDARRKFVKACCAKIAKDLGTHAPENLRGFKKERLPGIIFRGLDRLNKRRLPACRMVLQQWGIDPIKGQLGLNASAHDLRDAIICAHGDGPDSDNIRKDVWRESLPALSMALAMPLQLADNLNKRSTLDLLKNGEWVPDAIRDARQIAPIFADFFRPKFILYPELMKSPV